MIIKAERFASITEMQNSFLAKVFVPAEFQEHPFQAKIFFAEREQWWTPEERLRGKRIDQLNQAQIIAKKLIEDPTQVVELVRYLDKFKSVYAELESLPMVFVPQDGHPFNFFINSLDGKISMLDLEDISLEVLFADLATVYLYKILRAFVQEKISQDSAIEWLKATFEGYNSTAESILSDKEKRLFGDYLMGAFLNLLPQFGVVLRIDPLELDHYNLGMLFDSFMNHFNLLRNISRIWVDKFLSSFTDI